jgi:hypothetical protein
MPRPRCGNDPRAQLTDGDRQAIADFRNFLTRRAQEKTMSELSRKAFLAAATVGDHLAEQEQAATAKAEAALAPLEAKARALREQRDAEHRAEVLRQAAEEIDRTELPQDQVDMFDNGARWATSLLRRMADEAQR